MLKKSLNGETFMNSEGWKKQKALKGGSEKVNKIFVCKQWKNLKSLQ